MADYYADSSVLVKRHLPPMVQRSVPQRGMMYLSLGSISGLFVPWGSGDIYVTPNH
jgi:hypothetical protein